MKTDVLSLPRAVESDPRAARLLRRLSTQTRKLWEGGELEVPSAALTPALVAALKRARASGQVVRGLDSAERTLAAEERGQALAAKKSGVQRGRRVSRLLVLADDGSERFYRSVESLLRRHEPRVLALRCDVDANALGELLFGPDRLARLLMLEHKEAVGTVLLALLDEEGPATSEGEPALGDG